MARLSVLSMICLVSLTILQTAEGISPDRVKYSPAPPLNPPQLQNKTNAKQITPLPGLSTEQRPNAATAKKYKSDEELRAEQEKIWDSPTMQDARAKIAEFCRYSAQVSVAECKEYLTELSQLSPDEMNNWLDRYQAGQQQAARSREVSEQSRQVRVSNSLDRQEVQRNVASHIAELQRESYVMERLEHQQRVALTVKPFTYLGPTRSISTPSYNPFELVFDPASPRGAARQFAAGISLPGDLPAGDPANFVEPPEVVDP